MSEFSSIENELPSEVKTMLMAHMPEAFQIGLNLQYSQGISYKMNFIMGDSIRSNEEWLKQDGLEEGERELGLEWLERDKKVHQQYLDAIGAETFFGVTVHTQPGIDEEKFDFACKDENIDEDIDFNDYDNPVFYIILCKIDLTTGNILYKSESQVCHFKNEQAFKDRDLEYYDNLTSGSQNYTREQIDFVLRLYDAQQFLGWEPKPKQSVPEDIETED